MNKRRKATAGPNIGEFLKMGRNGRYEDMPYLLQVMIMGKSKKQYIGAIADENDAA